MAGDWWNAEEHINTVLFFGPGPSGWKNSLHQSVVLIASRRPLSLYILVVSRSIRRARSPVQLSSFQEQQLAIK